MWQIKLRNADKRRKVRSTFPTVMGVNRGLPRPKFSRNIYTAAQYYFGKTTHRPSISPYLKIHTNPRPGMLHYANKSRWDYAKHKNRISQPP